MPITNSANTQRDNRNQPSRSSNNSQRSGQGQNRNRPDNRNNSNNTNSSFNRNGNNNNNTQRRYGNYNAETTTCNEEAPREDDDNHNVMCYEPEGDNRSDGTDERDDRSDHGDGAELNAISYQENRWDFG